ncbi:ABC-type polysaccharide/polyol phosphate export permease [Rhodobacter aestuarii]|uniref:ABC-type polysaccharide/polyol phosphate export permease n=1 Tax=Rhodobacter aestuarii TaxID=453582 RepID=A0A1N7QF13_9RHOB|nr:MULTISPECIES: ABC transporter permease [Rhodobacter]PTV93511.1 ABC-type polysaccharide/polyol phosphate export permease [Rhodobacter aestuarii]SIT21404.1 ABC-type polysaccharide/polyol phosphate export permease [Rhodobacter aestuarii]SOC08471.1 ABC-type polysaccharide/polyol phosphate export permease [Rhodobacter sp. JA431]
MFRAERSKSTLGSGFSILELIYHATVRSIRKTQRHAIWGLIQNIMQTVVLVITFYVMFNVLGLRGNTIRGDFLLYIMSGIFLFLTHTKAMGAVFGSEGSASAMMKHAPMTTAVSISAAALGALYIQLLSMFVVLYLYHATMGPIEIYNWVGAMAMVILSWFTGVALGMVFLAMKPWNPSLVSLIQSVYARANMIASGKMFVANLLPHKMLVLFDWNPLFHTIDQARGFAFINYNPHFSSWQYPVYVGIAFLAIGLMGEFYTRQHVSFSWGAKH